MTTIHTYGTLYSGTLVRRYKRFLADVTLADGSEITSFTPNSGSMMTCSDPGSPVMLSHEIKAGRKTEYTLEMVKSGDTWVGVHTHLANRLAAALVDSELLAETVLGGMIVERPEFSYGDSRLDLLLTGPAGKCLAEVKNVTLRQEDRALFPDAATTRGLKHLHTLTRALDDGFAACMIYTVQRSDCASFAPASEIHPEYAEALARAARAGVGIIPVRLDVTPEGISFVDILPVEL
jgi:sugar fermentation stimulation protein A